MLRWHRELVGRNWAFYARRPRRGRPAQSAERHDLILSLARENPRWGYRRIQGELLKLGCRCSHGTVRSVLRRHGLLPAPRRGQRTWREFVRQNAEQLLAVDFFSVETLWFQRLHVLFCILTAISPVRLRASLSFLAAKKRRSARFTHRTGAEPRN